VQRSREKEGQTEVKEADVQKGRKVEEEMEIGRGREAERQRCRDTDS
jgi:hypothetical protein